MATAVLTKSIRRQHVDTERALIDLSEARRLFLRTVVLPEGYTMRGFSIARVYPSKSAGVGVQWEIRLAPPTSGPFIVGGVYATSGVQRCGGDNRRLRASRRNPFRLTGVSCRIENTNIVLNTPDQDEVLTSIVPATRQTDVRRRASSGSIGRILGTSEPLRIDCLNYRPRRRCVLRYRANGRHGTPFVVGKVFRNRQALHGLETIRHVRQALGGGADAAVRVPRVLAAWCDWNMLLFEGVETARTIKRGSSDHDALIAGAADVLAIWHCLEPTDVRPFTHHDEITATGRWVDLAQRLGRLDGRAGSIWRSLKTWAARLHASDSSLIHRDFYGGQLLQTDTGWALVDFDTAALGDREQDVGNFIGHLAWEVLRQGDDPSVWTTGVASFLAAYERASQRRRPRCDISGARLRFYLVSSLLRVGIIHSLRTGTERVALRLHDIAARLGDLSPARLLGALRDARPAGWSGSLS